MLSCNDVVAYNAMISGYVQGGEAQNAMKMFQQLQSAGLSPDAVTVVSLLPACALLDVHELGTCVHGYTIRNGFESDIHVKNALLDMYAKCGSLGAAKSLFNLSAFSQDEISWNIMITGCTQNGQPKEAVCYFHQMKKNFKPNLVTIVSILPAASYMASLRKGMEYHAYTIHAGFDSNTLVQNSLIDMYAKCGRLDLSQDFFNKMEYKDVVSWNVMLSGYAVHGHGEDAVKLFQHMTASVMPDAVSFLNILSACRHGGLVEEGIKIFDAMISEFGMVPKVEHYACLVDLISRAGQLDEAWKLVKGMPVTPDTSVWGALLGSCKMHFNVELGEVAANHLARLEPHNTANYIVLSNIYAQLGMWTDVGRMHRAVARSGLTKTPGCSWVELEGMLHAFREGDRPHAQFEDICRVWNNLLEMMKMAGYVPVPDASWGLQKVEEETTSFLSSHSERVAIGFAFLWT